MPVMRISPAVVTKAATLIAERMAAALVVYEAHNRDVTANEMLHVMRSGRVLIGEDHPRGAVISLPSSAWTSDHTDLLAEMEWARN